MEFLTRASCRKIKLVEDFVAHKNEVLFENADLRADLVALAPQLPVATPRIVRRFFLGFLCNSSPALRPVWFFLLCCNNNRLSSLLLLHCSLRCRLFSSFPEGPWRISTPTSHSKQTVLETIRRRPRRPILPRPNSDGDPTKEQLRQQSSSAAKTSPPTEEKESDVADDESPMGMEEADP